MREVVSDEEMERGGKVVLEGKDEMRSRKSELVGTRTLPSLPHPSILPSTSVRASDLHSHMSKYS